MPERDIETYTQALMDLGATVCTRSVAALRRVSGRDRLHRAARRTVSRQLPSPRPKKALPQRAVRVLVLERAGAFLLEKRPDAGIWAGLWSLPELDVDADVARHCEARFAADVVVDEVLPPIEHGFTHYRLTIHPQRVAVRTWPSRAESPGLLWLTRDDALAAALPAPIRKLIRRIVTVAVPRRAALILRRSPVAKIGRQQLLVIGVRRAKRRELPRGLHRVPFGAQTTDQRDPIGNRQRRAILDPRVGLLFRFGHRGLGDR